ncbi:hypothetical protein DFH09DRAFT_1334313 [Mycena vulgaris]|nr:hypothetical protein DFH09DRAFT_1334313 [Mycena vulgaris]
MKRAVSFAAGSPSAASTVSPESGKCPPSAQAAAAANAGWHDCSGLTGVLVSALRHILGGCSGGSDAPALRQRGTGEDHVGGRTPCTDFWVEVTASPSGRCASSSLALDGGGCARLGRWKATAVRNAFLLRGHMAVWHGVVFGRTGPPLRISGGDAIRDVEEAREAVLDVGEAALRAQHGVRQNAGASAPAYRPAFLA